MKKLFITLLLLLCSSLVKSGQHDWRQMAEGILNQVTKRFGNKYEESSDLKLEDTGKVLELTNYRKLPALTCHQNAGDAVINSILAENSIQKDIKYREKVKKVKVVRNDSLTEECNFYTLTHGYECVHYTQCNDEDGTILTDGFGLIDLRFGGEDEYNDITLDLSDKKCPGTLEVCCKDPDWEQSTTTEAGSTTTSTTTESTTTTATTPKPYQPRCGNHNENGLALRISGFGAGESQFAEWPHVCVVLEEVTIGNIRRNKFACGASLIAPGIVLSAAHCLKGLNAEETIVRCGEWDTQTENEPLPHQDRKASSIRIHPEYNHRSLANDFALIFLQEDFQLNKHIDTICLPQLNEEFHDERCFANGWGKDEFGSAGKYQVVLKEIDLPMWSHSDCQNAFRAHPRLPRRFRLHSTFICAGGEEGKDACKGDGGGPLVCPKKDDTSRLVQAGIVAWGLGCGDKGVPGAYAAVSKAVCWIDWVSRCELRKSYSLFGFGSECSQWMEQKRKQRLPTAIKEQYFGCEMRF